MTLSGALSGLEVRALSIKRGHHTLMRDVSFSLPKGHILSITGPNGCGKSTLLSALAGIYRHWTGDMIWDGQKARGLQRVTTCQTIGHTNAIKRVWTPVQNLYWGTRRPSPCRSDILAALEQFDIAHLVDTPCTTLSAGQVRRVCLARLLLSNAHLWLLDEPTTSLDDKGQKILYQMIQTFTQTGGTTVVTTHDPLPLLGPTLSLQFASESDR